ncbi:MAG: hypothetical protein IRZ16_05905 [Myxococcaceae bacterium]|nr:hypothetical protein [Myxococcaceae bacterium]
MNNVRGIFGVAALAALATATITVVACGPTKGDCGPTTCSNGCCSEDGVCHSGLTNDQCGFAGGQCTPCTLTQLCQAGVCIEFGNQNHNDGGTNTALQNCLKTCTGCCSDNGECLAGTDVGACGVGEKCRACPQGNLCQSGTCVDPGCSTCTTNGVCDPAGGPSNNTACGKSGAPCQVCSGSSSTCQDGICTGSCTTGCVDTFGQCKTGNTAGACGTNGNACVTCPSGNICVDGACHPAPQDGGSCKSVGVACLVPAECCSGNCDGTGHCAESDAGSCKAIESACVDNSECCSKNCVSGFCAPEKADAGCTKKSDGASCIIADECCSNVCTNGFCGVPSCNSSNCPSGCCLNGVCQSGLSNSACGDFGLACQACGSGMTCQPDGIGGGGFCQTVPIDAGSSTCQDLGFTCTSNADCCSALCSGGLCVPNPSGTPLAGVGSTACGGSSGCTNVCEASGSTPPTPACDPCVGAICALDDFCCNTTWDSQCAQEAIATCSGRCAP